QNQLLKLFEYKTLAKINQLSYPGAFLTAVVADKLELEVSKFLKQGGHDQEASVANGIRKFTIGILTFLPLLTYLESCYFLSNTPKIGALAVSILAGVGMGAVNYHHYQELFNS
ncbi:MAG: hypothetical protein KDK69_05210, partial [Chlamydiia bacterium]|nr:hypothetical protein [Chlamydiia bacterium]